MLQFLKDAWREMQHVVWPTAEETKRFFILVNIILILFGIYLFIAGVIFSKIIFFIKDTFF